MYKEKIKKANGSGARKMAIKEGLLAEKGG